MSQLLMVVKKVSWSKNITVRILRTLYDLACCRQTDQCHLKVVQTPVDNRAVQFLVCLLFPIVGVFSWLSSKPPSQAPLPAHCPAKLPYPRTAQPSSPTRALPRQLFVAPRQRATTGCPALQRFLTPWLNVMGADLRIVHQGCHWSLSTDKQGLVGENDK